MYRLNRFIVLFPLTCFIVLFTVSGAALAQQGTAGIGYFPLGYAGDTWTGQVTVVDDATNEITLVYNGRKKTESFVGVLQRGHSVKLKNGTTAEFKPSMIRIGVRMRVYYMVKSQKINGQKVKFNEIFRFDFPQPDAN
jgi:hypothetical protein